MSYNSVEDRNPPTVRRYPEPTEATQLLKSNTVNIKRKINNGYPSKAESIDLE